MPQRRGTITDQLTNVIQVIQLGRKTGVLTVERGDGRAREEGEIVFVRGQITEARGGQLSGQKALSWLCTWGACRFNFASTPSASTTRPLPALPFPSIAQTPNNIDTLLPVPVTPAPPFWGNGQQNRAGSTTDPLPAYRDAGSEIRPRRTRPDDEALRILETLKLSRTHRHLFLLIDGRRSIGELIRLTGRSQDEVLRLLSELERVGIIQQ